MNKAKEFKEQGNVFLKKRNISKALQMYTQGINELKNCDNSESANELLIQLKNNRAQAYITQKDFEKAIVDLKFVLSKDQYNIKGLFRISQCYYELGSLEKALEHISLFNAHKKKENIESPIEQRFEKIKKLIYEEFPKKVLKIEESMSDLKIYQIFKFKSITIVCFTIGFMQNNAFLIYGDSDEVIIIDAPLNSYNVVQKFCQNKKVNVVLTHGHLDHLMDLQWFQKKLGAKVYVHKDDTEWLDLDSDLNWGIIKDTFPVPIEIDTIKKDPFLKQMIEAQFHLDFKKIIPDTIFSNEKEIEIMGLKFKIIHTPGHSQGSICLLLEKFGVCFSGDTLFHKTTGRVDLHGGNWELLCSSIKEKLFTLPSDTIILPAHPNSGKSVSTIEDEIKFNTISVHLNRK